MRFIIYALLLFLGSQNVFAQPQELATVRRIPMMGVPIAAAEEKELVAGLLQLGDAIAKLKVKQDPKVITLLPDILIYYKAVDYAIKYHEFFHQEEVASAKHLLAEGMLRATALNLGKAPWTTQTGEVTRGYISKIDGSVQPYGLSIPEDYRAHNSPVNLSLWFHGRSEYLSELNFIYNGKGFFPKMPAMKNTIMLYPYGRYCNGFKFAGEVDILEALQAVKSQYAINENAVFNRGFSMGGAAVWQMAVHYPDWWIAANPGAGFAETKQFLLLDKEVWEPNWYAQKLLHLYDCTDYASNLANLPIVAYNGDKDLQKQASDVMEQAMKLEGLSLTRVIGPNTAHAYHPAAAVTVDSLLELAALKGKNPVPAVLHFTTYTLKYNQLYWLTVDRLKEHWLRTRVDAKVVSQTVFLKTDNVSALRLDAAILGKVINLGAPFIVDLDGTAIPLKRVDKQTGLSFYLKNGKWTQGVAQETLVKKHDLQGPIDDAFMSAFIVVRPTGQSKHKQFDTWSKSEMERFIVQWRRQFRGDAVVKNDVDITTADLSSNLILFGDAASNRLIARMEGKLPIQWDDQLIHVGDSSYSSKDHALVMSCPNPLNAQKYVVLNSGFTFREESFLNNAKQIAMLPDWAIIDLNTPPDGVYPGKICNAGFFDEHWQWKE